ncbi:MAG: hypothetical protein J5I98_34485 [Phaeodactylibacter sp.]|nr:hypothetical protein [Phaeodactylibacter sp.]
MNRIRGMDGSIKVQLLQGEYRPQLARGVKIPKPSGGVRQLGIPSVMDRLVQQSIHQVLSPAWEKEFSAFSYGFRPKRSAQDALQQAVKYINAGRQWVISLDLKSFFGRVNHDKLMDLAFLQLGVEASWARRFAYSRKGGWAIACSPIMGTAVTESRLRQRGYIPFLEYYLNVKYGNKAKPKPK